MIRPENRLEDRIKRKQPNTNKRKHTATATAVKNKLLNSRLFCFSLVFSALLLILSCLLSIRKKRRSSHVVVYCYHTQVNGLRYYELYQTLIVFLICFVPAVFFHHSHTHTTHGPHGIRGIDVDQPDFVSVRVYTEHARHTGEC